VESASQATNSVDGASSKHDNARDKTRSWDRPAVTLALTGLIAFSVAAGIYI